MSPGLLSVPQLTAVPDGSSPCPYEIASKKRNAEEAAREDEHLGQQVGVQIMTCAVAGSRALLGSAPCRSDWRAASPDMLQLDCSYGRSRCIAQHLASRALQDWRWQQRGKRQKGERPPIAAPSYGELGGSRALANTMC